MILFVLSRSYLATPKESQGKSQAKVSKQTKRNRLSVLLLFIYLQNTPENSKMIAVSVASSILEYSISFADLNMCHRAGPGQKRPLTTRILLYILYTVVAIREIKHANCMTS
jgi:hypothetical protein